MSPTNSAAAATAAAAQAASPSVSAAAQRWELHPADSTYIVPAPVATGLGHSAEL